MFGQFYGGYILVIIVIMMLPATAIGAGLYVRRHVRALL
jgi:hypothetical protein